jgi:hypothetical protein
LAFLQEKTPESGGLTAAMLAWSLKILGAIATKI